MGKEAVDGGCLQRALNARSGGAVFGLTIPGLLVRG